MDWPSFLATTAVGTGAGFCGAYLLWVLKRNYVRDRLLADRRNERRHQAILEALLCLGRHAAGVEVFTFREASKNVFPSNERMSLVAKNEEEKHCLLIAIAVLRHRLGEGDRERVDEIKRKYQFSLDHSREEPVPPAFHSDLRKVLVGLLD